MDEAKDLVARLNEGWAINRRIADKLGVLQRDDARRVAYALVIMLKKVMDVVDGEPDHESSLIRELALPVIEKFNQWYDRLVEENDTQNGSECTQDEDNLPTLTSVVVEHEKQLAELSDNVGILMDRLNGVFEERLAKVEESLRHHIQSTPHQEASDEHIR
jgi:uncharacterized coiled-coil protein SlyX